MHKNSLENVKLTLRKERAIPLVLASRTIEEGCRDAGISAVTWYAWLKDEEFRNEVERQRKAVITEALDRLKGSVIGAVEGLRTLLDAEEKNIRLRACREVLDYFLKARELEDIEKRINIIEQTMERRHETH